MQGAFLKFSGHENQRHQGHLLWEWLLEQTNKHDIRGGSAFRAMASFGRNHVLLETTMSANSVLIVSVDGARSATTME